VQWRGSPALIQQRFFSKGEISPTGDKKKPSATCRKELKKELPEHSPYFLEKKEKKKEEFARFR